PLPFLSLSIYYVSSLIHKKSTVIQQQLSMLTSLAQESYSGIRVVKSFVKERQMVDYFAENCDDYKEKSMELVKINALFFPLMMLIVGLSTIAVVYFGGLQINNGTISAGTMVEFIIYVSMLTWPVTSIGWIASIVQQADASQQRIDEFFNQKSVIVNGSITDIPFKDSIVFRNVSFVYPDTGIQALKNITFKVNKGDRIAIIGKTGSGKTTIAEMILRTFDPTSGQILIDGTDLRELDLDNWRRMVGYVPQDNFLFSDTIENNIRFGRDESNESEIVAAATKSMIHKEISELPKGYQTRIGERGVSLSGGQKQRTSIARALIKDPQVLILDDALSAVDANTEQEITGVLNKEMAGKTVFNITHRLNPNTYYDQILVLQRGEIAALGDHDTLYYSNKFYRHLIDHAALESM
ncbi:MAG TPA: ABC transporter ATP-binding protein, partial [Membranihabitans sp.]|nr:ABC transporter ATP-binding protein [Membranihabitans sp.]